MIRLSIALLIIIVCFPVVLGSALAGPTLDRILNNMILDVTSGSLNQKEFKIITPDRPIGQTFTTGPKTVEVSRIAIAAPYWHESWTEDEALVLTLWDSPAKTKQIASAEMPYKWRAWEGTVIMYTLNAAVQPSAQYYFELTVKGGDGEIVGIYLGGDYQGGQAFEAGKPADRNIWFEVHSRPVFDRDAVYADRFKDWNLDYPGLEKVKAAVVAKDWDKAVDELIAYYESRTDLVNPADKPKKNPDFDPTDADLVLDMKYRESKEVVIDLGPNWNHYRIWPTRGGVGLTRTGLFKFFRAGYINTGDEKYAKGFNEFMTHFLNDMPSPLRAGVIKPTDKNINPAPGPGLAGGSMWAGLAIGARMNQMWWFYSGFHSSPNFTRDIRAGMIFNMVDMANVLSIQKGGGNWESQMTTALYEFAERHPELAKSKQWFEKGINEMIANLWSTSRHDGSVQEPTFGYTTLIINRYRSLLETCRKFNISLEQKYLRRVEKTIEYLMYNTEPDGLLPSRGDTFNFVSGSGLLSWGADFFGREDFRYVATGGKEGRVPSGTSAFFPIGGWMVMRSDWSRDALYLNIHNGKDMGHGHYDLLSIVVDAYGAKLIVDPGCYIYGTPENEKLRKTTSHATVTVNDADTHVHETGSNYWMSMTSVDYYEGTNIGYRGLPGVLHTRRIMFLKPQADIVNALRDPAGGQISCAVQNDSDGGYWLVYDTVTGSGTYEVACRFPFFPGPVRLDESTGACRTEYQTANILVLPCMPDGFKWSRYEYGFPTSGNKLDPAFGVRYFKSTELPIAFATALIPYKGRSVPKWSIEKIGNASACYQIANPRGNSRDLVCFGNTNTDICQFEGRSLAVRTKGGRMTSFAWSGGKMASFGRTTLAKSDKPIEKLEVIYDKDTVRINSSSAESSLTISALGARWYRVGHGSPQRIEGQIVRPFVKE